MSGANTTIDARAALRTVIKKRYGVDVVGPMWSAMSPADNPPKGLRSADADDWQITFERASAIMFGQGYAMEDISIDEAEAARTEKLDASVVVLVTKASDAHVVAQARKRRRVALYMGMTAAAGVAVGLLTSHLARRGER